MYNLNIIGSIAVLLYLTTWGVIFYRIKRADTRFLLSVGTVIWTFSIILHGLYLTLPLLTHQGLQLDLISAGSLVVWLTSLILFITTCTRKIEILSLFVLPLAILIILIGLAGSHTEKSVQINGALGSHILLSLLGYSTLFLATLQAMLLSLQSRYLHNHKPGGLIRSLPALQDMENLLFRLILTGVILLSAGLTTGFLFLNDLFGPQVLHKTVLSIIAWVVYSTLLIGHWHQGWRGKKAISWTVVAFILLIIAFFGSKFVQEYLIQ